MKLKLAHDDTRGTVLIEYAITLSLFILVLFGFIQVGLLMWTQVWLQHAVEMAARCGSVNTTVCNNASNIKSYAASQSWGVDPPASAFTATINATCGANTGTLVSATYPFHPINYIFVTLNVEAKSCYPS
jgi:Flp pilus assembly protein TadG